SSGYIYSPPETPRPTPTVGSGSQNGRDQAGLKMVNDPRFLRAVHHEKTDCTPVWFMRQAGRYLEEYRRIRERHGLLDMFKNPEIAAEVTLQPLKAFPLDAAIIFADILLPLEAMGIELEFVEREGAMIP